MGPMASKSISVTTPIYPGHLMLSSVYSCICKISQKRKETQKLSRHVSSDLYHVLVFRGSQKLQCNSNVDFINVFIPLLSSLAPNHFSFSLGDLRHSEDPNEVRTVLCSTVFSPRGSTGCPWTWPLCSCSPFLLL